MDCLIVRQPFASLIVFGAKRWEFRSHPCDKRGTIAIAASKHPPIMTSDSKLNEASISKFPRGVVLGTAYLSKSYLITANELKKEFQCCQEVNIHGFEFSVACEPIGEPPDDVKMALNRKGWKKFVWELSNVKPLSTTVGYRPAHGSSWTKAVVQNEIDLMSFINR